MRLNDFERKVLIINAQAGHGRALRFFDSTKNREVFERSGFDIEVSQDLDGFQALVQKYQASRTLWAVAGGDGTLHHATNALLNTFHQDEGVFIMPIPLGSGSDFCRGLQLSASSSDLQDRLSMEMRPVDVGCVHWRDGSDTYFINSCSLGLPAAIGAKASERYGRLRSARYFFAACDQLMARGFSAVRESTYPQDVHVFMNGRFFGGGMHIAPASVWNDGVLEEIRVERLSLLSGLKALLQVYRGQHVQETFISFSQTAEHRFETSDTILFDLDGESYRGSAYSVSVQSGLLYYC